MAIGDAKRMRASLKVKAGSEPLYQQKVEQVQKCANVLGKRANLVMDALAIAKASSEGDENQLNTALAKLTDACQQTDVYSDAWREAKVQVHKKKGSPECQDLPTRL